MHDIDMIKGLTDEATDPRLKLDMMKAIPANETPAEKTERLAREAAADVD
jgi:hypothetical protein